VLLYEHSQLTTNGAFLPCHGTFEKVGFCQLDCANIAHTRSPYPIRSPFVTAYAVDKWQDMLSNSAWFVCASHGIQS
jgi:hypothetical protein